MERSGTRLSEIAAFRCRGGQSAPAHYEFRHLPEGEIVSKLADGWYRWTDRNGELKRHLTLGVEQQDTATMNGHALRVLRESLRQSQSQFATLIGTSRSNLAALERENYHVRSDLAAAAHAIARAASDGTVDLPAPRRAKDWHFNKKFDQVPPFVVRPACPCERPSCLLWPYGDGDWPGHGHLWRFIGKSCKKLVYVNSQGKVVKPIRKNSNLGRPDLVCSGCRRRMAAATKYSLNLRCRVTTLRCRRRPDDPPHLKHDPPQCFRLDGGLLRPLTAREAEILRGRSKRKFPVPKCKVPGCPRLGKTMWRSAVLRLNDAIGNTWRIASYRCHPISAQSHATYCVLPNGELAERIGFGHYRWTDTATGLQREMLARKRPIRKNRVMPLTECPEHHCTLIGVSGPWPIRVKDERGKRRRGERLSSRMQCWRARCPVGNEFVYVDSRGISRSQRHSRWHKPKQGPTPTKRPLFEQALILKQSGLSWGQVAKKLDPIEFAKDQRRATDRIRVGAQKLRHKVQLAKSASA